MGQGPSRGGHSSSDEYQSRQRGVDIDDAQQQVDEVIERVAQEIQENDRVDESDVGRVVGGAVGGFAGGATGGLAGNAVGSALGREAGGRVGSRYAAAQADREPDAVSDVSGVGESKAAALRDAGYESIEDLRTASHEELEAVDGIIRRLRGS